MKVQTEAQALLEAERVKKKRRCLGGWKGCWGTFETTRGHRFCPSCSMKRESMMSMPPLRDPARPRRKTRPNQKDQGHTRDDQ